MPLVYLTGILELALAAGFLLPASRRVTGWVAAIMLVLFFPANVYAAVNHVPIGGHAWGPVFVLWIYWFTIRPARTIRAHR